MRIRARYDRYARGNQLGQSMIAVLVALACSGCGVSKGWQGDYHVGNDYGDVQPQQLQFQGITWGVLDIPDDKFQDSPVPTGQMVVVSLGAHLPLTEARIKKPKMLRTSISNAPRAIARSSADNNRKSLGSRSRCSSVQNCLQPWRACPS